MWKKWESTLYFIKCLLYSFKEIWLKESMENNADLQKICQLQSVRCDGTWGHSPPDWALLLISSTVFLLESWSERDTNTGRMYLIRAGEHKHDYHDIRSHNIVKKHLSCVCACWFTKKICRCRVIFSLKNLMRFLIARADSMSHGGHYKKKSYYRKQMQAFLNACSGKGWVK